MLTPGAAMPFAGMSQQGIATAQGEGSDAIDGVGLGTSGEVDQFKAASMPMPADGWQGLGSLLVSYRQVPEAMATQIPHRSFHVRITIIGCSYFNQTDCGRATIQAAIVRP